MKTAVLKMLPVTVLKPAEYNPRKKLKPGDKDYEKIKRSIETFGFADPLVINQDMTVIGGHQRLTVAMALGYTEVPCAVVDVDKVREKALNIALNKITGAWDEEALAKLLDEIGQEDFDLSFTGFDENEISTIRTKHMDAVREDDFDVSAELRQPCFSKAGDLWILGRHKVLCGEPEDAGGYERLMSGDPANLILTKVPQPVNDDLIQKVFKLLADHLADDGSAYIFHDEADALPVRQAFRDADFYHSGTCIWKKPFFTQGKTPYQSIHETCLYGWKKKGRHQWYSDRKQTTFWETVTGGEDGRFPVALAAKAVSNSTMTNGIVLDPFMRTGSTLIACDQLDRVCYGMESDPKMMDVIIKRYIKYREGDTTGIHVLRNGKELTCEEAVKEGRQ